MTAVMEQAGARAPDAPARTPEDLVAIAYRSRAASPLDAFTLRALLESARARNRSHGITGMLVYDSGRFFQWIEGPRPQVRRLWNDIRQDGRHRAVEPILERVLPVRLFDGWDMRLAGRRTLPAPQDPRMLVVGRDVVEALAAAPVPAAGAFAALAPGRDPVRSRLAGPSSLEVDALARDLLAGRDAQADSRLDDLHRRLGDCAHLCADVLEPVERRLGDLWSRDEAGDIEVSLALGHLRAELHRLASGEDEDVLARGAGRMVMVAPMPGEPHALGSAMAAELLWQAGFRVRCEFPADDAALERLVRGGGIDAIVLSSSGVFERSHRLETMAASVRRARRAGGERPAAVVVEGRVVRDAPSAAPRLRADAVCASVAEVAGAVFEALRVPG